MNNSIFPKPYESQSQLPWISKPKGNSECRICLQTQQQTEKQLMHICQCKGSVQFVHGECFILWAEKTLLEKRPSEVEKIKEKGLQCELCKYYIKASIQKSYHCEKKEETKRKIQKHTSVFILFILIFIVDLGVLIALLIMTFQTQHLITTNRTAAQTTTLALSMILVLIFILTLIKFIAMFFVGSEITMSQIQQIYNKAGEEILEIQEISQDHT